MAYTKEYLSQFSYFNGILEIKNIDEIYDSLTEAISRKYFLDFTNSLIEENKQFTFVYLDLDNFKNINDVYGHEVGDQILKEISKNFIQYLGENGIFGRIGGDEFCFIYFKSVDYNEIHSLFKEIYHSNILRVNLEVMGNSIFITGTMGSVSYPTNCSSYKELVDKADKVLYRGKSKGRNCFIIWVEEKHKDIKISNMAKKDIYSMITKITDFFDNYNPLEFAIKRAVDYLIKNLGIDYLHFIYNEELIDGASFKSLGKVQIDDSKFENEFLSTNYKINIERIQQNYYEIIKDKKINSILMLKEMSNKPVKYIIYCASRTSRIWQNDEKALIFIFLRLLNEKLA